MAFTMASFKVSVDANPNLPILTVQGTFLVISTDFIASLAVWLCFMVNVIAPTVSVS